MLSLPVWRMARTVVGYMATGEEAATLALLQNALAAGKKVVVPRVSGTGLIWHELTDLRPEKQLRRGVFGIQEPRETTPVWQPGEGPAPVVWLIPGAGFDRKGNRLGRGGGYYDRALREAGVVDGTIGLGFSCQLVEEIPADESDWRIQWIATPEGCIAARDYDT